MSQKKNKQVSNKPVPHKPTRPSKVDLEVENANQVLHSTFYATNRKELYDPKSGIAVKGTAWKAPDITNGELSSQWRCTPRHASRVKSGRGTPNCTPGCGCPNAVKAAKAAASQPS